MEIGKTYTVPDERLYPKLVGWVKLIYDKFTVSETEVLIVAQILGHTSLSGAFNVKSALLSSYGLVDRRAGKIRITDIGRKIAYPSDAKEKVEGIKSAIMKIPLWERLYLDYSVKGAELPSNFWADLAKIAEIAPDDAKNKTDWVVKAYNADLSYLKSAERESGMQATQEIKSNQASNVPQKPEPTHVNAENPDMMPVGQRGFITFVSPDDGITTAIPRSARFIEVFKNTVEKYLEIIERDLVSDARMTVEEASKKKSETT